MFFWNVLSKHLGTILILTNTFSIDWSYHRLFVSPSNEPRHWGVVFAILPQLKWIWIDLLSYDPNEYTCINLVRLEVLHSDDFPFSHTSHTGANRLCVVHDSAWSCTSWGIAQTLSIGVPLPVAFNFWFLYVTERFVYVGTCLWQILALQGLHHNSQITHRYGS